MQLDLKLERVGNNNIIDAETVRNLKMVIKLAKNKARIQIIEVNENRDTSKGFEIPKNLFQNEDLELDKDGKIENLSQSNIGIHIVNHPFSFYLYRKDTKERLFDTTHSQESSNPDHYLYYAKNYLQISTRLPLNHYTYGLGERFTNLRLRRGRYVLYSADKKMGEPIEKESKENSYSSLPYYMMNDPISQNAYGALMFNSSPMEVDLEAEYMTFKMTGGIIDLFVFGGTRPREVIVQMQKTFGMPLAPPFSALNWQANMITNQPKRDLIALNQTVLKDFNYPLESVWIDYPLTVDENTYIDTDNYINGLKENGIRVFRYKRSPLSKTSPLFDFASNKTILIKNSNGEILLGKTSYGVVGFVDYLSANALSFIKRRFITELEYKYDYNQVNLLMNEPSQICNGQCDGKDDKLMSLPFIPGYTGGSNASNKISSSVLHEGTLPLTAKQYGADNSYSLLDTHNLYSLQEAKTYYTAMIDSGVKRPMIFSRSTFLGGQQYAGKWLGYFDSSWKSLSLAVIQTMNFNIMGNPNTVHEACGFSHFSPNPSEKLKDKERDPKYNQELCLRWLQFSSVNPFARLNDFELLKFFDKNILDSIFALRAKLSLYIYSYMVRNSLEGGSLIRPMFLDFGSEKNMQTLFDLESQFMLGSNLLISPVLTFNQRKKNTFFPNEKFYDFYTGEHINPAGEMSVSVDAPLNKLPIFARAGFITPIQIPDENFRNLNQVRIKPIELVIALDNNFRSAGSILIDNGECKIFL